MRRALLAAALLLAGCATEPGPGTPRTVGQVDLVRYEGLWFEAARFPTSFQDSARVRCEEVSATYSRRPDGGIGVVNRCSNALDGGAERVAEGVARSVSPGNDRLRVSFFWPFFGDYWVIGLDPDYRWAVVGAPGRDYLWVLSRERRMSDVDYAAALAIAAREGFDTSRLRRTRQGG
ncbi:lipocalin family protein [Roseomonas sp. PWR1]|uniref:Outer membrane lipoprotein Blc n=1 Tax=Roseomonas nitratireducens TaxID=2820810 RepID=A0ABS4AVV0_9PROT|nr:lipocalin family protein [Neoroseomonas nitratireducens]MBP0465480.1 lipocalin family protein [Neoroseomonas nitratireducens]